MQTRAGANISRSAPPGETPVSYKVFRGGVELRPEQLPAQVSASTGTAVAAEEVELVFPDGRRIPMILGAAPLFDSEGKPRGSVTAGAEISRLKDAEEALRQSEQRFRLALKNAPVTVAAQDRNLRFLWAFNQRTVNSADVIGKTDTEIFPPEDAARLMALKRRAMESGAEVREQLWVSSNGQRVFLDLFLEPTFDAARQVTGVGIATVDLTAMKLAQEALQEADRRKNEFMAVLSHELRNPLTPIRNSLYVLERAAPDGDQARHAREVIDRQSSQLARLVDDLLDVTRISSNKIQLQRAPLELGELVRRTVEDHRSLFEGRAIAVETTFTPEPLPIHGDAARLAQAIGNLLQNAAKFTHTGGKVTVATAVSASRARATIHVTDTGAGIEADMLRRLFEPFMQADATLDRNKGGLGLGLALVKGVVEMHGGVARAQSDGPGTGAQFVIELPLEATAAAEVRPAAPRAPATGRRVLIIEDNVDAAESLREVLEFDRHTVDVAASGPDGLAKAREFKPEVVLCDIGLPGMDGYEVARAFRADNALKGTFLVALSGYALPEDLERSKQAGFEVHLAKPPSIDQLQQLLGNVR